MRFGKRETANRTGRLRQTPLTVEEEEAGGWREAGGRRGGVCGRERGECQATMLGFPLQVNSNAKQSADASASAGAGANAERKCDWGLAGISVVKREHEGRGAAGWVILFDPVRGLDESTRQRLCSSARLPSCSSRSQSHAHAPPSARLLPVLSALSMPVSRALAVVP